MLAYFGYTNDRNNLYNVQGAMTAFTFNAFVLDVSDADPVSYVQPKPLQWELLDASQIEVQTRVRFKGSFTTNPELVINSLYTGPMSLWGQEFQRYVLSVKEHLASWAFARSRWIYIREAGIYTPTPDIFTVNPNTPSAMPDVTKPISYLQVVLDQKELVPKKFNNLLLGQSTTIGFSSVFSYDIQ